MTSQRLNNMTDLTIHQPAPLVTPLDKARAYAEQATAENTRAAYRSDWSHFTLWCEAHGARPMPADVGTVASYLAECADSFKLATIERRLVSISKAHQVANEPNPAKTEQIHLVMSGIRRALGRAQTQKAPATLEPLRAMLDTLGSGPAGLRDRALLLVGFAGAFRRSELVALDVADLAFVPSGVVITLRRSKTDQEGQGRKIGIPMGLFPATCPVRALRAWIEAAELVSGALFRPIDRHGNIKPARLTSHAVARIVKRCAAKAGLDAAAFSGHSLRAGLATAAATAGASDRVIMKQTGHKSRAMVDRYVRSAELFKDNAGGIVGL
jgi:integrase